MNNRHRIAALSGTIPLQHSPRTIGPPPIIVPPIPGTTNPLWPAWRQRMPINVFTPIPNSAPSRTLSLECRRPFEIFSGLGQDTRNGRVYSFGADGHAGGNTNWVMGVDLLQDAPKWQVIRPTDTEALPADTPFYSNGNPVGCHVYYYAQVAHINGDVLLIRTESPAAGYSGQARLGTQCFRLSTNAWDAFGRGWDLPEVGSAEGVCAMDPRTQKIYSLGDGWQNVNYGGVLDPATQKWGRIATNGGMARMGTAVIPELDTWFCAHTASGFLAYRIAANRWDSVTVTWNCPEPERAARGMWLCERQHAVYINVEGEDLPNGRHDLGSLYKIDYRTMTGSLILANTVAEPWLYTYNKIEDFPRLGCFVFWPDFLSDGLCFATE